ncbi:MAG: universal stress protein [Halalkalicoccus sp.]
MTRPPFDRVLLPVSTEEDARVTSRAARSYFDGRAEGLVFVHVIEAGGDGPAKTSPAALKERAGDVFAAVREPFERDDPVRTELRSGPDVIEEVFGAADEMDASAIAFVPRSGNRLTKFLGGDHERRLTRENHLPIIVLPQPEAERTGEPADVGSDREPEGPAVVVPIDDSEAARAALRYAVRTFPDAEIELVHVIEPRNSGVYESVTGGPSSDYEAVEKERRRDTEALFDEAKSSVEGTNLDVSTAIAVGNPTEMIAARAEEVGAEQIVMGRSGDESVTKRLFGGVSKGVMNSSTVPVTIVDPEGT